MHSSRGGNGLPTVVLCLLLRQQSSFVRSLHFFVEVAERETTKTIFSSRIPGM